MALFKPFRGTRSSLDAQQLHDGYAYFCIDDGTFHIDYADADGVLHRKQINAAEAEKLSGKSFDELKAEILAAVPSVDTSDFVSKSETDSQYLSSALEVLDYLGVTNSSNGDYYFTLGTSEMSVGDGAGGEYTYTFDNQGGTLATQEWVQANPPSIIKDMFTIEDEGHNNVIRFYPDGQIQIPYHDGGGFDSWYNFAYDEITNDGGGTIATREWVQANAPSVDTSNFVDKSSNQAITGTKTFTQTINAPSYKTPEVSITHMDYQYSEFLSTAIKVVAIDYYNGGTYEAAATEYTLTLPNETGTIATREWVQANAGGSVDTSKFVQQESESFVLKHDQGDGSNAYTYYNGSGVISYNPCDMAPATTTQLVFQTGWDDVTYSVKIPLENGELATREWVQANAPSVDTSKLVTTNTSQVIVGQKEFTNADFSTENWNNVYQMRFTYQDMFDANGSGALGLRIVAEDWSETGFFKFPELTGEAKTLATQEWVSAQIQSQITDAIVNGEW